jgi:general secretion pathway protein G
MKRLTRKSNAGFTLVEIMLVIVIVIALMAVLIPNLRTNMDQANRSAAEMYVNRLVGDLALYEATNGFPPTTQQGLAALMQKPTIEPIPRKWSQREERIERDPWGMEYHYEYPGKHNPKSYDVYSSGPDRTVGTDDDIGNWENK